VSTIRIERMDMMISGDPNSMEIYVRVAHMRGYAYGLRGRTRFWTPIRSCIGDPMPTWRTLEHCDFPRVLEMQQHEAIAKMIALLQKNRRSLRTNPRLNIDNGLPEDEYFPNGKSINFVRAGVCKQRVYE